MKNIRTGKSIWYGEDMSKEQNQWLFTLSTNELDELLTAADQVVAASKSDNFVSLDFLDNIDNFHLPLIKANVEKFTDQLHNGIGFVLWRGIPVDEWSRKQTFAAFLIIGKCMGNLRQQNSQGHVLGHVRDLGLSSMDSKVRVYQTNERQTFHTDSCDVVGLLCLKTAKKGGLSSLVSSGAIYNELLKSHPELLKELLEPLAFDKRGEVSEGTLPFYMLPVFSEHNGFLSVFYQRQYIDSAQRFPDAPRLTDNKIAALNMFDNLTNSLNFEMELQPGDMQFVHNHSLLHDRTAYEDWDESDRKRHLLRMWIATPNARPLPEAFAQRYGSVTVGHRGGLDNFGMTAVAPLWV
ncbi:Taurine hydroxylase-like protein SAT17 [Pseudolycoriella hygida]|uniref:Taurine hydroxylase-like protein SAT17 n=1 Tax=Pseudolycoriella hygida TaxID=35572 RepID=A0A9Q0MIT0_9DIPT|nr:Taurine hydroxylase-like protein SAT17 [Pseudolycoriella hygida]